MAQQKHIILYDGFCHFCNFWVRYVIKKDKKDVFRFASLQAEIGKEHIKNHGINPSINSFVLIKENKVFIKSTAALHVLKTLGGITSTLYAFIMIPKFIRDFFYDIIARYRYRWFGKSECEWLPNDTIKYKFLI